MRAIIIAGLLFASASCVSETLETEVVSESLTSSAIARGSTWRYWDQGGDLGTSWRGTTFADGAWESGAGPLGYGESYLATTTASGAITTYFRKTFTVDDPSAITAMAAEVMFDDGFVVYLNGLEIGRDYMPTGTITASTRALDHEAVNTYKAFDWTHHTDVLVAGTNTLAVEVHQTSSTSSDLVFDLALSIETGTTPPGDGAWLYWDNGGDLGTGWRTLDGPATGWDQGDGPLGFGESYIVTPTAEGHITTYFRRTIAVDDPAAVGSITGEVMYDDGFVAYLNGVEIQRAAMPTGTVTASTRSTGHEAENEYLAYDWSAHADLLVAGDNVLAFEVHQVSSSSSDLVFDAHVTIEAGEDPPVDQGGIARGSSWQYYPCIDTPPPSSWKVSGFGSCWSSGRAPLGYGESYIVTELEQGPITHYFFEDFYVDGNPTEVTSMIAEVMYDDGFVAYLNGVEVARASMPSGTVTSSTLATGHEANNAYVTIDLGAYRHLLRDSFNSLAVEVHQASTSSSDLVFDLALHLEGEDVDPPPPETGEDIARGSTWRYWDGGDPGSFMSDFYNDAQWKTGAGPIGYGESYLRTTSEPGEITTYFRRWFTVDDPTVKTRLIAELMYDDGVVVYLNGREVQRLVMPSDPWIQHTTLASPGGHEAGNRYETYDWSHASGFLVDGPNLLAVEVHQNSASSSDLVFDLSLAVDTPPVCAVPGAGPAVRPSPDVSLEVWVAATKTYAIGENGLFGARSSTGEWCWSRPIAGAVWTSIWSTGDEAWLLDADGVIARYDGAGFTTTDLGTTAFTSAIFGTAADDVWVVGGAGTVRHFDGNSWTAHDLHTGRGINGGWAATPDDVWILSGEVHVFPDDPEMDGSSGIVFRWDPATETWNEEFRNTMLHGSASFSAIHGTSATNVWVIGSDQPSGAACTVDMIARFDGSSWTRFPTPYDCSDLRAIAVGGPGATDGAWVGGSFERRTDEGGAYRYTAGDWHAVESPPRVVSIHYAGSRLYAAGGDDWWGSSGHQILRWDGGKLVREW